MNAAPAPLLVVEDNPVYAEILQRLLELVRRRKIVGSKNILEPAVLRISAWIEEVEQ